MLLGALSPNLLSKISKFSPKHFTFLQIKMDGVALGTWKQYHSGPLITADPPNSATQNFWYLISRGLGHIVQCQAEN